MLNLTLISETFFISFRGIREEMSPRRNLRAGLLPTSSYNDARSRNIRRYDRFNDQNGKDHLLGRSFYLLFVYIVYGGDA